jgi:hypothetical protein
MVPRGAIVPFLFQKRVGTILAFDKAMTKLRRKGGEKR